MKTPGGRRTWMIAAAGAVLVAALVLVLFRAPKVAQSLPLRPAKPAASVGLARLGDASADALLKDEATLFDPTPLFLPTEWNAGQNALPADARREPGSSFHGYPARTFFSENELKLNFPEAVAVPAHPAEALATERGGRLFLGLGLADQKIVQLSARNAFVEVLAAGNGRKILALPLDDAHPPGDGNWHPLEFLVAVNAIGLVGPPVLTESSRVAAVDGYFQDYLVKMLHVGERLAPGFYRICVGP